MAIKRLALAVSVGVMAVSIMGGCSSPLATTSHNQFIEVQVQGGGTESININHIVTVAPNNSGASILMDTSDGMNGGHITVTESYDQIVKELGKWR